MNDSRSASNPVAALADEFVYRSRQGERPSLAEYCERFPQYAEEIRRLFPTVMLLERMKPAAHELERTGIRPGVAVADAPRSLGDYLILRELGRGGMGIVYEAEQQSLGRRVALKILSGRNCQDARHVARFEREARSAARLHHTNIVPVFGVGEHAGTHYLVMQLIPGQGLDHVLDELRLQPATPGRASLHEVTARPQPVTDCSAGIARGLLTGRFAAVGDEADNMPQAARGEAEPSVAGSKLPGKLDESASGGMRATDSTAVSPARSARTVRHTARSTTVAACWRSVSRIGIDVARALEYAHSQGVLHRDIKPSNLLLDVHGAVWVADFGLAKSDDSGNLTLTGEFVGTLRYMAPERLHGRCDVRADVYSLGLTLFEMLTLTPAFDATDQGQLIAQVMQAEPRPPRRINPAIPADLETIVGKAISRDPDARYQSAGELAADLSRFLDDLPIAARRTSATERLWRWCRRNPSVAIPGVVCVLLLVAWAVTSSVMAFRLDAARQDAVTQRGKAETRRNEAEKHRRDAEQRGAEARANAAEAQASAETSRRHLSRLIVAQGTRLLEEGDSLEALPYFAEALRLDQGDPDRERSHRLRLQTIVRHTPRLVMACRAPPDSEADQISPDGKLFASGPVVRFRKGNLLGPPYMAEERIAAGPKTILVCEIPSCDSVCRLEHEAVVVDCAFSPDSQSLATACVDGTIRVWDVSTGELTCSMASRHLEVRAVAFVPDDGSCISAGFDDVVRLWDPETGALRRAVNLPVTEHAIAVETGGRVGPVPPESLFSLWSITFAREPLAPPLRHVAEVGASQMTADKRYALTRSRDRSLRLWDLSCASRSAPAIPDTYWSFGRNRQHSPDGRYSLGIHAHSHTVRDTRTGDVAFEIGDSATTTLLEFSGDGRFVLACYRDGAVQLWHADAGNPEFGSPASDVMRFPSAVKTAKVNSDGSRVVILSEDGIVRTWNPAAPQRPISEFFAGGLPLELYVSPDGDYAVVDRLRVNSTTQDSGNLWDLRDGRPVAEFMMRTRFGVQSRCAFSPDGKQWLHHFPGELIVRETATGSVTARCGRWPHAVIAADFLGSSRAVTGSDEGALRIWDLKTSRLVREIDGNHSWISSVHASPDDRYFASAHSDQTARVWDAETGELVALFKHATLLNAAWYAPDGKTLITLDNLNSVRSFSLETDDRPVTDWIEIANLLGGHESPVDLDQEHSGSSAGQASWERLRIAYPNDFSISAADELNWSLRSAAR